jgi:prepilin-type N-terminal cleavage/methylation domain-containing protein
VKKTAKPVVNQDGFTLTELLVAMGLSLFVLASIGSVFRAQTHTVKGQEKRMEAHEYALTVLDVMVREIRNTGYFPSATCDATGGIASATATGITIQYDKNGNGACSGDDEVIAFAYDSVGKNITRNGQALSDGNVTAVQFHYYPQQTSGTAPAPYCVSTGVPSGCSGALSSNLNSVKKIAMTLTVAPKSTDSQFIGSSVTMSLTADLRNHGLL